jgi:four helix bundle protein
VNGRNGNDCAHHDDDDSISETHRAGTAEASVSIRSHRDLIVWQRAMELVEEVQRLERRMPLAARQAMQIQLRRSVASIPANIAEGMGRVHRAEFRRFVSIARGSTLETATHLEIASRRGDLSANEVAHALRLCDEIQRMLASLSKRLQGAPQ